MYFVTRSQNLHILTNWYSKDHWITSLDLFELLSFNLFSQMSFLEHLFHAILPCKFLTFSFHIEKLHKKPQRLVLRKQLKLLSQVQNIDLKFAFRINTLDFCAGLDHCNPVNSPVRICFCKAPSKSIATACNSI